MTQLIATALAAITATIAASYLGVSGTVIGAALASVVSAVGNAVYGHSLRTTRDRVRVAVPVRTGARPTRPDQDFRPAERPAAAPASPRPENAIAERPPVLPTPRPRPARRERNAWRGVAIGAISVFVTVLAVVTGVEVVAGRPLADLVRGDAGSGTSVFGTGISNRGGGPSPTVTKTVIPKVVITTPTVTQTAPAVTQTATPTATPTTSAPGTGISGLPTSVPTAP
jgi:hypothetical protein